MADNTERPTEAKDDVTQIREEIRQEIDNAKKATDAAVAQKRLAEKILQELKDAQAQARRYARTAKKEDRHDDEGKAARKTLIRAIEVAKAKIDVVPGKPIVQQLLSDLGEKGAVDTMTACSIQTWLGDYLLGNEDIVITSQGQPQSKFLRDFEELRKKDEQAAERMAEVLVKRADQFGIDGNQMKSRLYQETAQTPEEEIKKTSEERSSGGDSWNQDETYYYARFTPEQREYLKLLYRHEDFINYVKEEINPTDPEKKREAETEKEKRRREIININPKINPGDLDKKIETLYRQKVSENIIERLGDVVNQLFVNLQSERPEKFFDEISQEDFMKGLTATRQAIKRAIAGTRARIALMESEGKLDLKLCRSTESEYFTEDKEVIIGQDKSGKNIVTKKPYARLSPIPISKEVSLSDFLLYLETNFNHYIHRQGYLYNSRAIYNHPAGEKGFYGQLADFAQGLSGTDIDEMMAMPDKKLVFEAFSLYDKFQDEEFAKMDWKHRVNQFTNKFEYVNTQVEQEVIDSLKKSNPGESETKLRDALNIAIGMSRGVFLNEPEKSSFADAVDFEGKGMFASYSTNDSAALTPLNPLHVIMRWQGEPHLAMYYFMPISNLDDDNKMKWLTKWDHSKMWEQGKKYKESYFKGRQDLGNNTLMIDQLTNICKIGGIMSRKGWRLDYVIRDYLEYKSVDEKETKSKKLDVLKSWQALENLGFDVIDFFVGKETITDDFLKEKNGEKGKEKKQFFEYLYKKYFLEDEEKFNPTELDEYLKELRRSVVEDVRKKIRTDQLAPKNFDDEIEIAASRKFLEQVINREIGWRFPTKFLRMDRDRFQKDGVSRWRHIYEMSGMTRDEFDKIMKNLGFAETLLRQQVSDIMRKTLHIDSKTPMSSLFDPINYRLTEGKLDELLRGKLSEGEIDAAKKVFNMIRNEYLTGNNGKEFFESITDEIKRYPFNFGLEDTDFTFLPFRGAGPKIIPRAIGDIGRMERDVIPGLMGMPKMLNDIATSGKHDFSPVIEYLKKVQAAYHDVHGAGPEHDKIIYKLAASVITYFKKDTMAKPLFGLLRLGARNSTAAEVAGRSTAVWEWDSRDIDRFCVSLESLHLLRNTPYDLKAGPVYEPAWINILGQPIKIPFFKKQKKDFLWNTKKLRKEFGGTGLHMMLDVIDQFGMIVLAFLLWRYFQEALKEIAGKNK